MMMDNNFTIREAISLLAQFCTPLGGCFQEELEENLLARSFVEAEYASLDEEYKYKYFINETGKDVLLPFAVLIASEFVVFMRKNGGQCSNDEIKYWFADTYNLDAETADEIADYFCNMLGHFSMEYKAAPIHSSRFGNGYTLEKK